ncbi:hypothetical protein ACTFIU_007448 [Dictyostelium citrinum]
MVVKSKPVKKFALKKKTVETTSPNEEIVNNNDDNNNNDDDMNETTSSTVTKSILKKKKVEKVEKKKVIIQTEKNQTQLFNKTLKISDKPLIIKSASTKKDPKPTPPLVKQQEEEKVEETVEPIIQEPIKSSKKVSTTTKTTTKKETTIPKNQIATTTTATATTDKKNKKTNKNEKPIIEEKPMIEEEPIVQEEPMIEEEPIIEEKPKIVKEKKNNNKNKKKQQQQVVETDSSSSDSDSSDEEITTKKNGKKVENTISGFTILPVQIENSIFKKYIYIKKETNKKWPQNKTLFVTNLPTHCQTLEDVKKLFKYDFIESVHFGQPNLKNNDTPTAEDSLEQIDESTKHVAHIVMKDQDSLKLFLKKSHSLSIQQPSLPLNGFNQLLNQYNSKIIVNYDELQIKLDNIMIDYDKRVLESKKRSKSRNVPDEEGFITVGPSSAKVMTAEEVKALMEKKQKKNFYAFQHRQTKKDELDVLRQKFEEDKQRISKITAARKFKPY